MIEITLPFPPSVNTYWRSRNGKKYPTVYVAQKGKEYKALVRQILVAAGLADMNISYALAVEVNLHMPDRRVRDIDNYNKALLDSITSAGLWNDDSQIELLTIRKAEKVKAGKVVLFISPMNEEIAS